MRTVGWIVVGVVASVGLAAWACTGDSPLPLGDRCVAAAGGEPKTCGAGAVCSTVYCRVACTTDGDCGSGGLCIVDANGVGGCRLKSEESCSSSKPCTEGLACASDGTCRQPCSTSAPCKVNSQSCWSDGTCHSGSEPKTDGGVDSGTDAGGDAGDGGAPPGEVDPYETTQGEYLAFIQTNPPTSGQPAQCAFNSSYTPQSAEWNPVGTPQRPVSGVDWCDAYAYCKYKGRRLCGKIGGGDLAVNEQNDFLKDQWYAACSSNGQFVYPYGASYAAGKCRDDVTDGGGSANVGAMTGCRSPLDSGAPTYDMSGNIYEFTGTCDNQGDGGAGDFCSVRGGSHANVAADGQLKCNIVGGVCRGCYQDVIGFRCCK